MALIELNISLYTTYSSSDTRKLKENQQVNQQEEIAASMTSALSDLAIWPHELKSTMLDDQSTKIKPNVINHETYLSYVHEQLHIFKEEYIYYQNQLKQKTTSVK